MEYGGHLWTDKGHLSVIQTVMVKTIQSSFPPCPNFDRINVTYTMQQLFIVMYKLCGLIDVDTISRNDYLLHCATKRT